MMNQKKMNNQKTIKEGLNNLIELFNPFGKISLQRCIKVAYIIGYDESWVYNVLQDFQKLHQYTNEEMQGIDPCYVIYDKILDAVRWELINLIPIDVWDIEVLIVPNYSNTHFFCSQADKEAIEYELKVNDISFNDISSETYFFLKEIGIL